MAQDAVLQETQQSVQKKDPRKIRRCPIRENPAPLSPLPPDLPLLYIGLRYREYNVQREQALPVIRHRAPEARSGVRECPSWSPWAPGLD